MAECLDLDPSKSLSDYMAPSPLPPTELYMIYEQEINCNCVKLLKLWGLPITLLTVTNIIKDI
jgi:hypothetical protein